MDPWDVIDALDKNDDEVRQRTRKEQAETVDLLAALVAHLYVGLQQRSTRGFPSDAEQWAATFIAHGVASLKCAFDQLLTGYYSQAIGMLRNVMEDSSVVAYLSHHPDESAKLSAARSQIGTDISAAKVQTGEYRKKLASLGDAALAEGMAKAKEMVEALHQYAHPSLYAVTLALTDDGVAAAGYYAEEDFTQAAYMFVGAVYYLAAAVASLIGNTDAAWTATYKTLTQRIAAWLAQVNTAIGAPEVPQVEDGTSGAR